MTQTKVYPVSDENCPVQRTLAVIGGKWTLLIIYQIGDRTIRFAELRRQVLGISEKMLSNELQFLAENGIVHRQAYDVVPPKVEYRLTDKGKKILPILKQIETFGLEHLRHHRTFIAK